MSLWKEFTGQGLSGLKISLSWEPRVLLNSQYDRGDILHVLNPYHSAVRMVRTWSTIRGYAPCVPEKTCRGDI